MSSCFVGFNLSSGEHPSFGIWHEHFFLSYLVLKHLSVIVYTNNPYSDFAIDIDGTSFIKIGKGRSNGSISFQTSGEQKKNPEMSQSHIDIGPENYE